MHEELLQLKTKYESPMRSEKPFPILNKPIASKPVVLLNKCPQNASPSNSVPTLRRKRRADDVEPEIPIEISEIQMVDNGEYEIRILQTDADGNEEVQLVEIEKSEAAPQYEIISEEIQEVKEEQPKKIPKKNSQSPEKKPAAEPAKPLQDPAPSYYYKPIDKSKEPELDENNEKKIFQCAFNDCTETFTRRQQCKTHYHNHLAVDSNYSCKYCSKRFKVQSALERHERTHTKSKVSAMGDNREES
jgi:hypothetical protein